MGGAIAGALVLIPAGALAAFEGVAGAAPPGHSGTAPGRGGTAPGHSGTAHGSSNSAPADPSPSRPSSSGGHGGAATMPAASPSNSPSPQPAPAYSPQLSSAAGNLSAGGNAPPGNNGTIKIEDDPTPGAGEANHPRVGCQFMLSFFGYDSGTDTATVSFSAQPPSGSFTSIAPVVGPSSTAFTVPGRAGGNQLDASYLYRLDTAGLSAQPRQGYHIEVTADVSGSQGADEKHKVFWYSPCATSASSDSVLGRGSADWSPGGGPGNSVTSVGPGGGDTPPQVEVATVSLPFLAPHGLHGLVFTSASTADSASGPDSPPIGPPGTGGPPPEPADWLFDLGAGITVTGGALGVTARRRRRRAAA